MGVHRSTVSRFLTAADYILKSTPKKIILTKEQKIKRLDFAKKNIFTNFKNIIFSDEKKFNLTGPDLYAKHYSKKDENIFYQNKQKFGGGSIMVHVCVRYDGPICMNEIKGKMNSEMFCKMFEDKISPLLHLYFPDADFLWQQDNCPIHNSTFSKNFFTSKNIKLLEWPSRSPDLNIVENIFSILSASIYSEGKVYKKIDEVWEELDKAFKNLDLNYIKNLYDSIIERLLKVVEVQGDVIKY